MGWQYMQPHAHCNATNHPTVLLEDALFSHQQQPITIKQVYANPTLSYWVYLCINNQRIVLSLTPLQLGPLLL